ncbi:hypothetical protein EJ04DRAFT_500507 [Polyplosphaeria fusca]|uniref:polynucleotide adenylyltransferase n=1 Tax=Polyplosphaeria fusca TaxID=682080 RepID=A0A9P4QSV7_9PLEO|nr:hypothetical protein EJ04DRAFT_500507 [Polyplosphaeria fusca]
MAGTDETSHTISLATNSYDTALCIIPPQYQCRSIDDLRSLYDKGYGQWPPHINLIYPFVAPEILPRAKEQIERALKNTQVAQDGISVQLNQASYFSHKTNNTIFLCEDDTTSSPLKALHSVVLQALGQPSTPCNFHMTIGQSEDTTDSSREFLLSKAKLLPQIDLRVTQLAILVRERIPGNEQSSRMRLWPGGSIQIAMGLELSEFWLNTRAKTIDTASNEDELDELSDEPAAASSFSREVQFGSTYEFDKEEGLWVRADLGETAESLPSKLTVSSYNVLIDSEYPPARDRDPLIRDAILSESALADVVVLQEVSDDFLSFLLADDDIRQHYPYTSHGPPSQHDLGPLPSLRNVVMLSKAAFYWDFVPFHRRHKGAVVATFGNISQETVKTLAYTDTMMVEAGLMDTWSVARVEAADRVMTHISIDSDDLFEGEEGATFNPRENELAAATSGTSQNRPQRYDRILVRPRGSLRVHRFNHFGLPGNRDGMRTVPSDHWGVRASIEIVPESEHDSSAAPTPLLARKASANLADKDELMSTLSAYEMLPTDEESKARKQAISLIKEVILGTSNDHDSINSDVPLVIVTVGSCALGVWTSASDIDCLCIGSISSKTFFNLARQRIHKARDRGVRLLRRVNANSGTMLELSVNGVSMDLQYAPSARVVERWAEFPKLHHSDDVFNLSILSLRKLKPYRDVNYILRTLPSPSAFQTAYRAIKLWAVQRGLYSSKFGYLGGVHLTLMLFILCKRMAHHTGLVIATDLVATFFHHFANFDWETNMLFDPFFHKKTPRYQRSAREPMVILGLFAPNSNIAHQSTVPGLKTLTREFKNADACLSKERMTWEKFFDISASATVGVSEYLRSQENYIKVNIQYWGKSLAKGKGLVGWVESRCLLLVVEIHKALSQLEVRIWPARFTENDTNISGNDYQGCYLIGLSRTEESTQVPSREDRVAARQALDKCIERFQTQLQADEKYYDPSYCWIGIDLVKPSDVKSLRLDDREWGDDTADLEPDSDDEDDNETEDLDEPVDTPTVRKPVRSASPKSTAPVSGTKLRPASDVLNRLRWDPNLESGNFIVGYEDRFLGAKETSLERWKTEQTDDEFIPQHRILYFKRKEDGVIVWERRTRVDLVFGSGVSAESGGLGK